MHHGHRIICGGSRCTKHRLRLNHVHLLLIVFISELMVILLTDVDLHSRLRVDAEVVRVSSLHGRGA